MIDYFEEVRKIISAQYGIDEETIEEDSKLDSDLNISELDMEDASWIWKTSSQFWSKNTK